MQFDGPEIGDYDRKNGGKFYEKDKAKPEGGEFILALGGGESAFSAAERKRFAALLKAEGAVKNAAGYEHLLRQAFESTVQALIELPADEQGDAFHAVWDQPVIAGEPTARLKIWRGKACDNTVVVPGKKLIALQASRGRKILIDCTKTMSPERRDAPHLEIASSFAEMAMDAPLHLRAWQRTVTDGAQAGPGVPTAAVKPAVLRV